MSTPVSRSFSAIPALLAASLVAMSAFGAVSPADAKKGVRGAVIHNVAVGAARAMRSGHKDNAENGSGDAAAATETAGAEDAAADKAAAQSADQNDAGADYYTKRAQKLLKGAKHQQGPHPLAVANPGMDVVVCMGGCRHDHVEIVYIQPTKAVSTVGEMQQSAAKPGNTADNARDTSIVCIGGCYEKNKVFASPIAAASGIGEWTTAAPSSAAPAAPANRTGSGDWMRTIDKSRGETSGH